MHADSEANVDARKPERKRFCADRKLGDVCVMNRALEGPAASALIALRVPAGVW